MRRRLFLVLATLASLWTIEARLSACSCAGPMPACQAAWYSPVVFVGQVTHIEDASGPASVQRESYFPLRRVKFRVAEVLRGAIGDAVVVHTGLGGGDCGYAFETTKSYLVYTHQVPDGPLTTGICSRTRPVAQASGDLAYLRTQAREPPTLGTIYGVARTPDPRQPWAFDTAPPYSGGRVVIESAQLGSTTRYEAVTAKDGRYQVEAPFGRYRATLHVRDGLYATPRGQPEVFDTRGCGETNFTVRPDGRVRGRVLDAEGRPVEALSIDILSAESLSNLFYSGEARARTDADGVFEFTRLAPGAYLLGLLVRRDGRDAESTAVWLSNERDEGPVRVDLTPEARAVLGDLRLRPPAELVPIQGVVQEADGSFAKTARVYVLTSPASGIAGGGAEVGDTGAFSFTLIAGRTYRLSAEIIGGLGSPLRRVESQPFVAGADLPGFTLRLPAK